MIKSRAVLVVGALLAGYLAGQATSLSPTAAAQQAASSAPPAWAAIPLAPNQGEVVYWSTDDLRKAHAEMSARSNGRILSKPRDLLALPMMRTHMFDVVHRPQLDRPPT